MAAPNQAQLQTLLNRLLQRVVRRLEREGLLIADPTQPWLDVDFHEPMDSVSAAYIRYRIAIGPHPGQRTWTLHDPAFVRSGTPAKILTADRDGFSLNAAVACQAWKRLHPASTGKNGQPLPFYGSSFRASQSSIA